jgi:hypothetical protein
MLFSTALAGLAGCQHLNWEPLPADGSGPADASASDGGSTASGEAGGALTWWSRAVEATPAQRDAMLRNARQDRSAWRIAMLRSLPGIGDEESLEASQESLRAQLKRGLRDEEEALTRIRLAELGQSQACRAEATELRTRLGRIIEIERDMGHGR